MSARRLSWWGSPWIQGAVLGAVALALVLQYGVHEYPLLGDRAWFVYLGQSILRGDPIYPTRSGGYPPLASLVAAASMWLGGGLGVPTYLAPRYLGVAVAALSVSVLYRVARRALASAWAGALAALVLTGFSPFAAASISNLEPKGLVVLFMLLACLALQRRSWWGAGAASALAATCYLPAALIVVASMGVTLWAGRRTPAKAALQYAAGSLLGVLPAVLYLTAADAWADFWRHSVVHMAAIKLPRAGPRYLIWLEVAIRHVRNELLFLLAAALGSLGYGTRAARRGPARMIRSWLHPRLGGVPVLTLLWLGYSLVSFDGGNDLVPLLPLAAFWAAWAAQRGVVLAVSRRRRHGRGGEARPVAGLVSLVLAFTAVYGFADAFLFRPAMTLSQQEEMVRGIVEPTGPGGTVVSFNAPEVYVFSERPSPVHPKAVYLWSDPLLWREACRALIEESIGPRPDAVVILRGRRAWGTCLRWIHSTLSRDGYASRGLEIRTRDHGGFVPRAGDGRAVGWVVYERGAGG